jgi:carboxymethylenebutenolidase
MGEWLTIDSNGASVRAYSAAPPDGRAPIGGVVLAMHLWGVDQGERDAAHRFAEAGYLTLTPDLYSRMDAPSGEGISDSSVLRPFAMKLVPEEVDSDLRAAAAWVSARTRTLPAIAGFCMGGMMALRRATAEYTTTFSAAAIWYGSIERAGIAPGDVRLPIVGSFGADDKGIPVAEVEAFRDALSVPNVITIYDGADHAFCDATRAAYNSTAADDSWRRTLAFLESYRT